ncbi:MAG: hypothetical protein E6772_08635 [Dysgonomonas sp.]|nr:hypothetical protein [Dysgonomonas sp.]
MSNLTQQDPIREEDSKKGLTDNHVANTNKRLVRVENLTKKDQRVYTFRDLVTLSRNLSQKQFEPSEETHKEAIERILPRYGYPKTRFLYEFIKETERVLDSKRFEADCRNKNLDPKNVAQHIVFAGDKFVNAVIAKGLENAIGSDIVNMTKPIFNDSEIKLHVLQENMELVEEESVNTTN